MTRNLLRAEAFATSGARLTQGNLQQDVDGRVEVQRSLRKLSSCDGRDQHIWFFSGGRSSGATRKEPFSTKEILVCGVAAT